MKKVTVVLMAMAGAVVLTAQAFAGSVSGTVKFDGTAPNFKEIKMDADPICVGHNKEAVFPQTLVLGDGQTMANVFIQIKNAPKSTAPTPTEPVVIDQQGCNYHPHVVGVLVNQPVKILNPDGTLHNVHAMSKVNPEFNLAMPKFRTEVTKTFDKPEFMFALKCDVHPWMLGWIAVMPHPYFAVTGKDGKFTIKDLPDGNYEVEAWHEKLGTKTGTATVAGGDVTVDFSFSAPTKA